MRRTITAVAGPLTIRGRVYSPRGRASDVLPAIVISHEFASNMLSTARYARAIVDLGYHVVIFDFAGSGAGRSTGRPSTEMSVLTEAADLELMLGLVRTRPYVDAERIVLGGCSQGGLVSALVAARHPQLVSKLFLMYPAFSIPDDMRRGSLLGVPFDPDRVPERLRWHWVRLGRRYVDDARTLEPWAEIAPYAGPVLVCHGTDDHWVDASYAEKAARVYPDAALHLIPGAKHLFLPRRDLSRAIAPLRKFLAAP